MTLRVSTNKLKVKYRPQLYTHHVPSEPHYQPLKCVILSLYYRIGNRLRDEINCLCCTISGRNRGLNPLLCRIKVKDKLLAELDHLLSVKVKILH